MNETQPIETVLDLAAANLSENPKGELILPWRKRIWVAFGPREFAGRLASRGVGHKRRATLAILSARHVMPLWDGVYPNDREPARVLAMAERYVERQGDANELEKARDALWTHLDGLVYQGGDI